MCGFEGISKGRGSDGAHRVCAQSSVELSFRNSHWGEDGMWHSEGRQRQDGPHLGGRIWGKGIQCLCGHGHLTAHLPFGDSETFHVLINV